MEDDDVPSMNSNAPELQPDRVTTGIIDLDRGDILEITSSQENKNLNNPTDETENKEINQDDDKSIISPHLSSSP